MLTMWKPCGLDIPLDSGDSVVPLLLGGEG